MRELTRKQKTLLKRWHKEEGATSVEDLTGEQLSTLEDINDTEILYQEVDRFLGDLWWDLWSKDNANDTW